MVQNDGSRTQLLRNGRFAASPRPDGSGITLSGEALTLWTIRLSLAAYCARLAIELTCVPRTAATERLSRWLWTIGCLFLWLHVACAFEQFHAWSHASALAQTARDTARVTGLDWGGGLWINYVVMLLWAGDVVWWWLAPQSHRTRGKAWEIAWQGGLAFIVFNALVVFKTGPLRWTGLLLTAALLTLAIRRYAGWRGERAK